MTTVRILALGMVMATLGCVGPDGDDVANPRVESESTPASFLGEPPPGLEAVVFGPGRISIEGRYEYALSIHPKGERILFSAETREEGASVHATSLEDGQWTTPVPIELTEGARRHEMEAFFSPDGERVFFAPYDEGMDVRIWSAEVTPTGTRNPQPLGEPVSKDPSFYPVQAMDGSLYYTNLAERTIFRATVEYGQITSAVPAGIELGGHAFPAPDGSFVVLDSASLDSDDQRDIYVAFRNEDGSWGSPRPLGPEVNTEHSETCPSLSPDGRFLFFSRYDEPGGLSDIYWISAEIITGAEPA